MFFLLIASFGMLFAGCSRVTGPNDGDMRPDESTVFTSEDLEKVNTLPVLDIKNASGAARSSDRAVIERMDTGSGEAIAPSPLDPSLARTYATIRQSTPVKANTFRVVNEFVNIRKEANIRAESVARLEQGQEMLVTEFINASWAKVKLESGQEGYVSTRYIAKMVDEQELRNESKLYENQYFVSYGFVNVRKSPDSGSEKIGEILGQTIVKPLSHDDVWARVSFEGKEGYVSMQFLSPFQPQLLVRQSSYQLPILQYTLDGSTGLEVLATHVDRLKREGFQFLTLRNLFDVVLVQESRDARLAPKSVVVTVSGITPGNLQAISSTLLRLGIPATFFLQTNQVGISGISEKQILTLQANGFDIQSGGHTGDDLRGVTNAQLKLELEQSRLLLEELTNRTIFAVQYPAGGTNERVQLYAEKAGYLFGISDAPGNSFTRNNFLRLPGYSVKSSMTADDLLALVSKK